MTTEGTGAAAEAELAASWLTRCQPGGAAFLAECETRYVAVCERAWSRGCLCVVAMTWWIGGEWLRFDVAPHLPSRGKRPAQGTWATMKAYTGGALTGPQAKALYHATREAQQIAPRDTITYGFCFPPDYLPEPNLLDKIIGPDRRCSQLEPVRTDV
jgi:hypothetical protein